VNHFLKLTACLVVSAFIVLPTHISAAVIVGGDVVGLNSTTTSLKVGGDFSTPGAGSIEINGGSTLTTSGSSPFVNISPLFGSSGSATVTGTNSTWRIEGVNTAVDEGAFLTIGRGDTGSLNINGGGKVILDGLGTDGLGENGPVGFQIGRDSGASGSVLNISGPGSQIIATNADHTIFTLGRQGASIVNVSDHGALITGGDNSLISMQNGVLNVNSGGQVETQIFNVAPLNGNSMAVNLDGAGTLVHVTGGGTADNEYELADFGGFMTIGGGTASAIGEVNMTNGAEIRIDSGTGIAADGTPIEGSGFSLGGNSAIGFGGEGTLNVSSNSLVTVSGGGEFVGIGRTDGGGGTINIDSGGQIVIENNADSSGVFMATNIDSGTAVLNIDGPASLFDAGRILYVGVDGALADTAEAMINIKDGATVRAAKIAIGGGGRVCGVGNLVGNVFHHEDGILCPGTSPGTLTIDGDYVLNGGVLEIEIAGLNNGFYDVLNVTGSASLLSGTVLFSFLDGFLPQKDDALLNFLAADGGLTIDSAVNFDFIGVDSLFEFDVIAANGQLSFDALSDAQVPEPGSVWLFLVAISALAIFNRRNRGAVITSRFNSRLLMQS
jgi:T5SS/PEP-CTERM-associated repeat protein